MKFFCGCCGVVEVEEAHHWCKDCSEHVLPSSDALGQYIHFWDRTFYSAHSQTCPVRLSFDKTQAKAV